MQNKLDNADDTTHLSLNIALNIYSKHCFLLECFKCRYCLLLMLFVVVHSTIFSHIIRVMADIFVMDPIAYLYFALCLV